MIFTQYTDTMDYVRDQLLATYSSRVACYSGRGGERWNAALSAWEPVTKESIKTLFREGVEIKILIGTDALSEGLNLQTSAKLVNYDMPWNLMRVEQRIGRVDRIGGREQVDIANYFYKDTVEEQIYRGIGEDFEWFEDVVGPAQPVLNQIEAAIESVAMEAPGEQRERDIKARVTAIRDQMRTAREAPVTIMELGDAIAPEPEPEPAIDLAGLERILTTAASTAEQFTRHPTITGAYLLARAGGPPIAVTFRRHILDEHSSALRLLTYGTPELTALLPKAPDEPMEAFAAPGGQARTLAELEKLLESQHNREGYAMSHAQLVLSGEMLYATDAAGHIVLVPERLADEIFHIRKTLPNCSTWGDARRELESRYFLELVDYLVGPGEEAPPDDEPLDTRELTRDGDWPGLCYANIVEWLPEQTVDRTGRSVPEQLRRGQRLGEEYEDELIRDLRCSGMICRPDSSILDLFVD